ncbi:hypothetical protein [Streptomyces sp. SJL17-1]|uniref:hypothetical protein n=1 Tax=Streptomyces sp. SJL17-1 TaxID=2967223 RepID=UPI002966B9A3|nr:hypothetical protein [Streptomyces sp. SJL17-1]
MSGVEGKGGLTDTTHARDDDDQGQAVGPGRQQTLAQGGEFPGPAGEVPDVTGDLERCLADELRIRGCIAGVGGIRLV